jgi:CubicO group peptidase (beta-lactamase class C family)
MTGTGFAVDDPDRLATLYLANPATGRYLAAEAAGMGALAREALEPTWLGGGGGLVSTAADYHRFTRMLLGRGEVDGVRILGSRTVDYMARNHLPGGADLEQVGRPLFAEMPFHGVGFGLGFAVVVDPVRYRTVSSPGEISWGGAASTAFWVDPVERVSAMFFTQLLPSSAHPIRTQLRALVYQALVD